MAGVLNGNNESRTVMECTASYSLSDKTGQITAKGDIQVKLEEETISLLPKFGEPLFFSLRDILEMIEGEYKIVLILTSNEHLTLFNLGYRYEDFLRVLSRLRNELLLKDMLMQETLKKSGAEAEFVYFDEDGSEKQRGKCEPRLYETALVIIPEKGEITRIPYSDISGIQDEDFTLTITTDFDEKFVFSMMGKQFDPFTQNLSGIMNELSLKVQSSLKDLLPIADPSVIRRAARFMKEGKAARRSDLESISPQLWEELEKKLEVSGIKEEYDFLKSLAWKEKMCIGLKRGLLGDLTGEYIWFLIPIYSTKPDEAGNAVAMEAISAEGGGKATYFFRIVSRKDYPNFKKIEELHREVDNFIKRINRCMLAINFRREPIYLPDEKLEEPQYQKYKFAVGKIPALQELRQLFIGRVIHSSPEQWKKDVMDLLRFNVGTHDDSAKHLKYKQWAQSEAEKCRQETETITKTDYTGTISVIPINQVIKYQDIECKITLVKQEPKSDDTDLLSINIEAKNESKKQVFIFWNEEVRLINEKDEIYSIDDYSLETNFMEGTQTKGYLFVPVKKQDHKFILQFGKKSFPKVELELDLLTTTGGD